MKKRVSILLFLLCSVGATAWAQSCSDIFSDTQFQPKSGISSPFYKMDECKISDPLSLSMMSAYAFDQTGKLNSGSYAVSNKGAQFQMKAGDLNKTCFLSLILSDLITQPGKNMYRVKVQMTIQRKSGCTSTDKNNEGRCNILFRIGNQQTNKAFEGGEFSTSKATPYTWNTTFMADAENTNISLSSDWSSSCALVTVQSIEITGCVEQKIASENGNKVCAGELNTFTAKGIKASSYLWEVSYDNKATWKTLEGKDASIEVEITQEAYYRVTAGGTTLTSELIRPVICCSVAGSRTDVFVESFNLTGNRGDLPPGITTYQYKPSGNIDEGQYAIVKTAAEGGYWKDEPIRKGHTGNTGKDGFMLVNCTKETGTFFTYRVTDKSLCTNTVYDFSAWITNVDNVANHAPVNAAFKVIGYPSKKVLVETSTGNLPTGTEWIEKGGSFNSGTDTEFEVTITNNWEGKAYEEDRVAGNDIGIDDIRFSACSPEIRIYSDDEFKEKVEVCNDDKEVQVGLEALAVYDLTDFFQTPYYQFQLQEAGAWKNVYASETEQHATTNAKLTINVTKEAYEKGISYRVWVGASQEAVDASAKNGKPGTGCGALTAASEPITITYHCNCSPEDQPVIEDLTAPAMICISDPQAELTLTIQAKPTETPYSLFKNGTEIQTGVMAANETSLTYKDAQVSTAEGEVIYQFVLGEEGCTVSKETTVQVVDEIVLSIVSSATDNKVCAGDSLDFIEIEYTLQPGESITWKVGDEVLPDTTTIIENLKITQTTTYEAILNNGICAGNGSITIEWVPPVEVKVEPSFEICAGDSVAIAVSGGDTYQWIPEKGLSNPTSACPIASPDNTMTYTIQVYLGECYGEGATEVMVNSLPVIDSIQVTEDQSVNIQVSAGTPPYQYSTDNENFELNPFFSNLVMGHYDLYVIDDKGCRAQGKFEIEPAPIAPALFFTPDGKGDPATEVWTIKNLDTYPSYVVEIFDRHGKRLYAKRTGSFDSTGLEGHEFSWDGTYNGHPMPSDDYWYLITLENVRKQYTGHFTLKR